jgi:hypothetical protein
MPDFERSATVAAGPEDAFRFLADPGNLPRYIARMVLAEPGEGERLRVAAEVEGRHEEGDARFWTDPSRRRVEWGAEEGSGYRGWLQVSEASEGAAVTIHLHVEHGDDEAEINRVLDETVMNVERLLGTG